MKKQGIEQSRLHQVLIALTLILASVFWARTAAATVIDIMIVYDTTASSWVASNGGMDAFAQDAVTRMNQASENTGLDLRFRLVHAMSVGYTTTSLNADLTALQSGSGALSEVAGARDHYGADIVAMLIDTGSASGFTGLGYLLASWSGHASYAHTVNSIRAVAVGSTLTHEVGHNLGADHAKDQSSGPGPNMYLDNQYSAGWYFRGANGIDYHTIMAYNYDGYGGYYDPAPLFSTPLKDYQGVPAGDPAHADNRRLLEQTKDVVAAYRDSAQVAPMSPTAREATDVTQTSFTANWSGSSGAQGYELTVATSADFESFVPGFERLNVGADTSQSVTDLTPGSDYFFRIRAYNAAGLSEYSNSIQVSTGAGAVDRDDAWRVAEIYIATMGYAPDDEGQQYWVDQIQAGRGWTPTTVAQSFFDQPLVQQEYPASQGFGPLIESLYANIFGRGVDTEGYDYWLAELASGRVERNQMIIALINGGWDNPDAVQDMARFGNQVEVSLEFAAYQAQSAIVYSALSLDDQVALRAAGREVIADVTADVATREAAITSIPSLLSGF